MKTSLTSSVRSLIMFAGLLFLTTGTLDAKVKIHSLLLPTEAGTQVVTDTNILSACAYGPGPGLLRAAFSESGRRDHTGAGSPVNLGKKTQSRDVIPSPFYKKSEISLEYSQIDFRFRGGFGLSFRLYDQGAAYRFYTTMKDSLKIVDEAAGFVFQKDHTSYIPYSRGEDNPFFNSHENIYTVSPISGFDAEKLAFLPLLVCLDNGMKMVLTESDLESYPGMYLRGGKTSGGFAYQGVFAPIPSATRTDPFRGQVIPVHYSDVLARTAGQRTFPWRIMAVSEKDTELPVNDLVYALGAPNRIGCTDWIKPGKVAWDWWNNWGVTGVDFPVGINTQTYKYFIDFASDNGIEYVVLDEGWSPPQG